jgi:arylsulfatase
VALRPIGRTYKNHIDGYNFLPYLTGKEKKGPRQLFVYLSDDGDVLGLRLDNWKIVFMEQRCRGTMAIWGEPFTKLRVSKMFNLRTDPFEYADITSNTYYDWFIKHVYIVYATMDVASKWAATFQEFPPIQKPNTFTLDDALAAMSSAAAGLESWSGAAGELPAAPGFSALRPGGQPADCLWTVSRRACGRAKAQ